MDPIEELDETEDEGSEPSSLTPEEIAKIIGYNEALKHTHTLRERDLEWSTARLHHSTKQVSSLKRWFTIAGGAIAIIAPCIGGLVTVGTYLWQANERLNVISNRATSAIANSETAKRLNEETRRDVQEMKTLLIQMNYKLDTAFDQIKAGAAERVAIRETHSVAMKGITDRFDAMAHDREVMAIQQGRMEQQLLDLKDRLVNKQGSNGYPWPVPSPLEKAQR